MAEVKITAELRSEFGKGASRRIRRGNRVPAVVYGHGIDPLHVSLPGHEVMLALKTSNVLISLDVAGRTELVIPKAVQKNAIKGFVEHLDLLQVERGEKVSVEIPVVVVGELAPGGNLIEHVLPALPVEAEATHIPASMTVSVEGLAAGDTVHAKDITLPSGVTLAVDEDAVVLQILAAQAEAPAEAEAAEGMGAAE